MRPNRLRENFLMRALHALRREAHAGRFRFRRSSFKTPGLNPSPADSMRFRAISSCSISCMKWSTLAFGFPLFGKATSLNDMTDSVFGEDPTQGRGNPSPTHAFRARLLSSADWPTDRSKVSQSRGEARAQVRSSERRQPPRERSARESREDPPGRASAPHSPVLVGRGLAQRRRGAEPSRARVLR